ncbi:Pyruvate phosphate dikinase, PEP/pyruvate binding domain [Syntrophus gentianae]|uniref:Phosphoenolpyruvate synthase n=1 Tax=Syntrophus gentianae TaxID=43775 RepID=A0A1H7VPX1_9BACT|nr:PEP/pyruvate-binding domain-containing protein [Syntrophus gentianae]SEM11323.1 Pyruvate phosphate dikinase, PEP/pyruvate binding domain [Syntrophus gentianae]
MFVKKFEDLKKDMFEECGGKAAHLGEMTSLGLSVPPGFAVLGDSYYYNLKANNLEQKIAEIAATINYDDFADLEEKTAKIRELINAAPVPPEIEKEIVENYKQLSGAGEEALVAIRSSVAVKDSPVSSFPGMMDTFHFIRGAQNVVDKVREVWASVWSARGAFARYNKKLDYNKAVIAPTVQRMVNSEMAGVLFTMNPINGNADEIVVEGNWGLGETVVCGKCQSDMYIMTKNPITVKKKIIAKKYETYIQSEAGGAKWEDVPADKVALPTLTDNQIENLCRTALKIEKHYGVPQDIEWAYEKGKLYILQARTAKAGSVA